MTTININNIIILIIVVIIMIIDTKYLTLSSNKRLSTEGKLAYSMETVCCIYSNP